MSKNIKQQGYGKKHV